MTDVVEATELVPYQPAPVTLFRSDDPAEVVASAAATAEALAEVIRRQNLSVKIQGREHVRVEGWTLLGSMLGVFPICEWSRKLENGWEARVVAQTRAGETVGAAEAECLRSEKTWANRDDYALRSMAQTRATSKALRQPLGFVMTLAGFDATPAEEMPRDDPPEGDGIVDHPGEAGYVTEQQFKAPAGAKPITEAQMRKINVTANELSEAGHLTTEQIRKWSTEQFGKTSKKELTSKEASALIEWLLAVKANPEAEQIPF